ncbi:hypothetical protein HZB04_01885 [Candidatus Wolfebacteria bacterium]|nr:hypothetical protein [Candidatus Wolfebacteria bacterium]
MLILYLFNRFIFRIQEFLRHWYVNSFFIWSHNVVSVLERMDNFFALKITWRHFFEPLYQDHSLIGYILGFIFRFGRLISGLLVYIPLILLAVVLYAVWLAIPFYIVYRIFH